MLTRILSLMALTGAVVASAANYTRFEDTIVKNTLSVGSNSAANSKAIADLASTTKGVLLPRMTTTQQNAITSVPEGLFVYDNVLHRLSVNNGTAWLNLASISGTETLTSKTLTSPTINGATLSGTLSGGTFTSSTLTAPTINAATLTGTLSGGTFTSSTLTAPTINAATLTGTISGGTHTSTTLTSPTINGATLTGTLSGGTFTSSTMTSPVLNGQSSDIVQFVGQVSTPASPSSGNLKVYAKTSDSKLYKLTSAGVETEVGAAAGSGTGSREYLTNTNAETNTTGWSTYADAAATSPVDGTAGTASNLTFTRTTTTAEIVRETASFKLAKSAANAQGMGVSTDFTADLQDVKNTAPIYVSFDYATSANYASSDIKVFAYDRDTSTLISVSDANNLAGALPAAANGTKFTGVFYPINTTSVNFRLIFHVTTTNATAYNFFYDSVHAGGANLIPSAIITAWQSYTPTGSWVSNTTYTGYWRRVGDTMEVRAKATTSGAPTNTSLTMSLPSGYLIDTTKISSATAGFASQLGEAVAVDASTAIYFGSVVYNDTSSVYGYVAGSASTYSNAANFSSTAPFTFGAADSVEFKFKVPIAGWSSGSQISTGEMLNQTPVPLTASSNNATPFGTAGWPTLTTNSITLTQGTWRLIGTCKGSWNTGTSVWTGLGCGFSAANGANNTTTPALLNTTANLTELSADPNGFASLNFINGITATSDLYLPAPERIVKCASTCTVYLTPYIQVSSAANARIQVFATAQKQPDFSIFGVVPTSMPTITEYTASTTYNTPAGARALKLTIVGAGGGGRGGGTTGATSGGNGGDTIFGSYTAGGGKGSTDVGAISGGGDGGTVSGCDVNLPGTAGGTAAQSGISGGNGGASTLGGAGRGGWNGIAGTSAQSNSGSGAGGGGAGNTSTNPGGGGGAGGTCIKYIPNPVSSYALTIGAAGTNGAAGTTGYAGGTGGAGKAIVEVVY
jgi:hypothetical protein